MPWLLLLGLPACGDDAEGNDDNDTGSTSDQPTAGGPEDDDSETGSPDGTETGGLDTGGPGTSETGPETGTDETGEPTSTQIQLELWVDELVAPTGLAAAPDGGLVVLDQPGMAYWVTDGGTAIMADLSERIGELNGSYDERGLLGAAFHPDYPRDPRFYVWHTAPLRDGAPDGYDHTNVLAEYEIGEDTLLDPTTERILLELDWPYSNHNGGQIEFGPDGMLYVGLGDGGNANDEGLGHPEIGNGQDVTTLLGSIVRIDPDGGDPYGIPDDNPFVEAEGADEIWAYGLRNPYSLAFDPNDGRLFVGDAGQNLVEEIDLVEGGNNYGWNIKEGSICFDRENPDEPLETCADVGADGEPLIDPIFEWNHPGVEALAESPVEGTVAVGGRVYRGSLFPELDGAYIFGDWSRTFEAAEGQIFIGREAGDGWTVEVPDVDEAPDGHIGAFVRGFGQDADGEVYVLTSENAGPSGVTGVVWRIVPMR